MNIRPFRDIKRKKPKKLKLVKYEVGGDAPISSTINDQYFNN